MLAGKMRKIIIGGVLLIFLIILFVLFNFKKDVEVSDVFKNKSEIGDVDIRVSDEEIEKNIENNGDDIGAEVELDDVVVDRFLELNSELSKGQVRDFKEIAKKVENFNPQEVVDLCNNRSDSEDCRKSVAFLKQNSDYCHIYRNRTEDFDKHEHDDAFVDECIQAIIVESKAGVTIKCEELNDDDYYNCLNQVFNVSGKQIDCSLVRDSYVQSYCIDLSSYELAYGKYNKELCVNIKNEKLNKFCNKNIKGKTEDIDNDGLTDLDEINIYNTHYKNPDTDNDGYLDGEEVKAGYNPLGEGKLIITN